MLLLLLRLCGRLEAQKGVATGLHVCVDNVLSFSGSPLQMGHISNVACSVGGNAGLWGPRKNGLRRWKSGKVKGRTTQPERHVPNVSAPVWRRLVRHLLSYIKIQI